MLISKSAILHCTECKTNCLNSTLENLITIFVTQIMGRKSGRKSRLLQSVCSKKIEIILCEIRRIRKLEKELCTSLGRLEQQKNQVLQRLQNPDFLVLRK